METHGCGGGEAFAAAALFSGQHGTRINYGDTYAGEVAECRGSPNTASSGLVIN